MSQRWSGVGSGSAGDDEAEELGDDDDDDDDDNRKGVRRYPERSMPETRTGARLRSSGIWVLLEAVEEDGAGKYSERSMSLPGVGAALEVVEGFLDTGKQCESP